MTTPEPVQIGDYLTRRALAIAPNTPTPSGPGETTTHQREFIERWRKTVPPRFRDASLDGLDPDTRDKLASWGDHPKDTLIIAGPVGTGKTWAAWATLHRIAERGITVAGVSASVYIDAGRPGGTTDRWANVPVLLIDDLGAEHSTEWALDRIYTLVDHRWEHELATVVTTNLAAEGFREAVGARVWSRLSDGLVAARLAGDDLRGRS